WESVVVGVLPNQVHAARRSGEHRAAVSSQGSDERDGPIVRRRTHDTRRARKKSRRRSRDAAAETPEATSMRWLSRRSRARSYSDPAAPALGSEHPETKRAT